MAETRSTESARVVASVVLLVLGLWVFADAVPGPVEGSPAADGTWHVAARDVCQGRMPSMDGLESVVLHAWTPDGSSLATRTVLALWQATAWNFPEGRVAVEFNELRDPYRDGSVLHVPVIVYQDTMLVRDGNHGTAGTHCNGRILMEATTQNTARTRFILTHEAGHALGLGHKDGTFMQEHVQSWEIRKISQWSPEQWDHLEHVLNVYTS